jgi:FHA domain-containing protein
VSVLLRFERRIEALVEGLFTRWSRDRVHPVEIGRRVLREMEAGAVAGLSAALLPNDYRVFLNPKDFAPYESLAPTLVGELAELLRNRAEELGARLAGPVRVSVEPREAIASGEIYVEARLSPDAQPSPASPAGPDAAPAGTPGSDTRIYRRERPAAGARLRVLAGPAGTAGRDFLLDRPVLTIGRRADQDIVIDDPSVSRTHARIHVTEGEAAVEDLGSTNGTALNGRPIGRSRVPVHDGDRIQVGNALLQYRRGA